MDIERQAQIVKQSPARKEQAAHARRLAIGQRTVERFVKRLHEGAPRLEGAASAALICAAAEAHEGPLDLDLERAQALFDEALGSDPGSEAAHLGRRRVARLRGDSAGVVEGIERQLAGARGERRAALQRELAQALLYMCDAPRRALMVLEEREAARRAEEGAAAWFGLDDFLLWEDVLWGCGQWKRYEALLREALANLPRASNEAVVQMLEQRLLYLYQYVLPDRPQAELIVEHLMAQGDLDPELLELSLRRLEREGDAEGQATLLARALAEAACAPRAGVLRMMLSDLTRYAFGDLDHAAQVLRAGLDGEAVDPLMVYELLDVQHARGDAAGLVEALGYSLEVLEAPRARADVLYRIGTLLDEEMRHTEAAEEVFAEALRELPTHGPSLRSLGRIYQGRQDWEALAAMRERQLEVSEDPERWRDHFRLAELYEGRLDARERAFDHYQAALGLRPADMPGLEGAGRLAAALGRWEALLELYAAAEGATEEEGQRVELLERIARVAERHLDDLVTARKALEGLRVIDPRHPGALADLARLYARQGLHAELVALHDEALGWAQGETTRATLLCKNGELCDTHLGEGRRAEGYYRRALELDATFLPALEGLERILRREQRWEDLVAMGLAEAEAWGARPEAVARLQAVADVLERELERPDEAIGLYWRCLELDPTDQVSREALIRHHEAQGDWAQVCAILEAEAEHGGRGGHVAASLLRLGKIRAHELGDEVGASDALRRAFLSNPSSAVLLRAWLGMARQVGALDEARQTLASVSGEPASDVARVDLLMALTEFSLRQTHDPLTAAGYLEVIEGLEPGRHASTTLYAMALARSGRWKGRARLALAAERPDPERRHGVEVAVSLGVGAGLEEALSPQLVTLASDEETTLRCWSGCPPSHRPPHHLLPAAIRRHGGGAAQTLRRWSTLVALRAGLCTEPASILLPSGKERGPGLGADLELLAAFYEQTRQWELLLQVLAAQEEMATTNDERVRIRSERCAVLEQLDRPNEARVLLHGIFEVCGWEDPVREALYTRLEVKEDWAFLIKQLRRHLMNTEDPLRQSELWQRLSQALEQGPRDLDEALRALDAAYRCYPSDGGLLSEISRVAEALGEVPIARRALDDYLMYHQPPIEAQLRLAPRLVELHIHHPEGGDAGRVLAWLEDLVARSCDDPRSLRALADAHSRAGNPYVACDVLLRLAKLPYRRDDLELWLMLAALYGGPLREPLKAEALYWELLANFAGDARVWQAIDAFYQGVEGRERLVEQLTALLGRGEAEGIALEHRRRLYAELGRILGEELGRWRESQDVLREAIAVSEQPAPELARQRAVAMSRTPGGAREAYEGFCKLLVDDPFQADVIRQAVDLCEGRQAHDRARVLRQLARFFTPDARIHLEDVAVRPKVMPTRPLATDVLERHLLAPGLRGVLYEALHEALPVIEAVFSDDLPELAVVGGKRLRGKGEMSEVFDGAGAFLGLGAVKIYLGNDESPEPMVFASPGAFWIPRDQWEAMDAAGRRHWAGHAAGLLWTGLSSLAYLDGREVWQLLDGVYYAQTGESLSPHGKTAYTLEAAEKVKSGRLRRARKEITRLLVEAGDAVHPDRAHRWTEWLKLTGARCGLVFSGEVGTSLRAMLAGDGWRGELDEATVRRQLERTPRLRELLAFSLSDDYLALRHAAGLGPRPSDLEA